MNTIDHNLGINIASVSSSTGLQLIPSDARAAVFWLTHPKYVCVPCCVSTCAPIPSLWLVARAHRRAVFEHRVHLCVFD